MNLKTAQISAAFLIGLIVGGVAVGPVRREFRERWEKRSPQERMLARLSSKLQLSSEQKTKLAAIFQAKKIKIDALMAEGRPKFEAIRNETREEIRAILNSDQIEKFNKLDAEMEARFKKRFEKHH